MINSNTHSSNGFVDIKHKSNNEFCSPHHLNNYHLMGYQNYLKNKQEGRWLVYSWAALILQPLFFIFYKMYFLAFIYSLIFGWLFGLNFIYGIAFIVTFPLFAFKLYELNADLIYFKSLKKFKKFESKYSNHINNQKEIELQLEKVENNHKISDRKKNKKKTTLLTSLKWNYKLLSPYTYFYDKIKPLSFLSLIPVSFFILTFFSIFSFYLFTLNNPIGIQIKEALINQLTIKSNKDYSSAEKIQNEQLLLLNNLSGMIYNIHEQYFIDSMLKEKQILTNDSYLIDFNNVVNGNNLPIQNKEDSNTIKPQK